MKQIWLLYDRADLTVNADFAAMMEEKGRKRGLLVAPVTLDQLALCMDGAGAPYLLRSGRRARPDAVLSRMRDSLYSRHLEAMGVPVFNGARVCEICNDKRRTHQFLSGLPMPESLFLSPDSPPPASFPVVVKPACSHGGDRVTLAENAAQWQKAVESIRPAPAVQQRPVDRPGRDLRVYVLFGEILAAVLRTAKSGVVSNFKRGGSVELRALAPQEEALAKKVIRRFADAGAPLCFAGVDLLYEKDGPVVGEVEDVVGSRMLYQVSDIDAADLLLARVSALL